MTRRPPRGESHRPSPTSRPPTFPLRGARRLRPGRRRAAIGTAALAVWLGMMLFIGLVFLPLALYAVLATILAIRILPGARHEHELAAIRARVPARRGGRPPRLQEVRQAELRHSNQLFHRSAVGVVACRSARRSPSAIRCSRRTPIGLGFGPRRRRKPATVHRHDLAPDAALYVAGNRVLPARSVLQPPVEPGWRRPQAAGAAGGGVDPPAAVRPSGTASATERSRAAAWISRWSRARAATISSAPTATRTRQKKLAKYSGSAALARAVTPAA